MFLRVVAALLSLARFDDLVRRDAQAKRRAVIERAVITAAALVAVTAGVVLAALFAHSRNLNNSEALAQLAGRAADEGYYDRAARYALAGFAGCRLAADRISAVGGRVATNECRRQLRGRRGPSRAHEAGRLGGVFW